MIISINYSNLWSAYINNEIGSRVDALGELLKEIIDNINKFIEESLRELEK
jgi:hypothetical protein